MKSCTLSCEVAYPLSQVAGGRRRIHFAPSSVVDAATNYLAKGSSGQLPIVSVRCQLTRVLLH